ncbi:MAG: hypothetical protein K0Q50_1981 [Vampirovibrio sp.]|jgi:N-acetylglucosaminyldiphosphoundecaprenol N-acetyl-beta-D-mannosaminyltransferase|nr:hypothetical protein [Vampirovibrio sp.]
MSLTKPAATSDVGVVSVVPTRTVTVDDIPVSIYVTKEELLAAIVREAKKPGKTLCLGMNAHNANMAHKNPFLKRMYQNAEIVYCDGAGVMVASRLLRNPIPTRHANGDWFFEMWDFFAKHDCTIYYLGSEPGIVDTGLSMYEETRPRHTVVGVHHGYILKDKALEAQVIAEINRLKPDILFVGFGCPLQEKWIAEHMHELNVSVFYAIGASMDYVVGRKPRCPVWLGNLGCEWIFRLFCEPKRLYHRYLVGNPWFITRVVLKQAAKAFKMTFMPGFAPAREN